MKNKNVTNSKDPFGYTTNLQKTLIDFGLDPAEFSDLAGVGQLIVNEHDNLLHLFTFDEDIYLKEVSHKLNFLVNLNENLRNNEKITIYENDYAEEYPKSIVENSKQIIEIIGNSNPFDETFNKYPSFSF